MVRPAKDSTCYQQAASSDKHENTTDKSLDNKTYHKDVFNFSALNCLFSFLH